MIASLPMYERPETQAAQNALWRAIRATSPDAAAMPPELSAPDSLHTHWRDPDLVFSQTCGLPLRLGLLDRVQLLGTPDYGLPDCPPGHYNSVIVMRRGDRRAVTSDLRFAINSYDSQSGWGALNSFLSAKGHGPRHVLPTGAHRASGRAVLSDLADCTAIDAQTWRMMQRWDNWAKDLREVARTEPTPGLPFIAAKDATPQFDIARAIATCPAAQTLDIRGIEQISGDAYRSITPPPQPESETACHSVC